jgi:hypothetical protein
MDGCSNRAFSNPSSGRKGAAHGRVGKDKASKYSPLSPSFQENSSFKQFCFVISDSVYQGIKRNTNSTSLAIIYNAMGTAPAIPF